MGFLEAVGYVFLLAGAGSTIGNWLLHDRRSATNTSHCSNVPLGWGWSFLIGAAATGLFLYLPLAVGGKISQGYFLAAITACVLLTILGLLQRFNMRRAGLALRRMWIFDLPWPVACILLAAIFAGAVAIVTTRPTTFDARATFLLKARLLHDMGTISGEDFQDVNRLHFNAHYPLLIPLHEAAIFHLTESTDDRCTRVLFVGFVFALGSIVARELRRLNSRRVAALIAAALASVPLMVQAGEGGALTNSVDLPLACYVTTGALACMNWLRTQDPRQAVLSALMFGAAVLTKSEGMLWVMAAAASMLGLALSRRVQLSRQVFRSAAAGIALLVVMLAVFMAVRRQIPYSPYLRSYAAAATDWNWLQQLWLRPIQVFGYVLYDSTRPRYWSFAWVCVAAALLLRRGSKLPADILFSRALLGLVALTFFGTLVITPYHVYWQMSTAMHRLSLQMLPLAWIVAAENLHACGWLSKFEALWLNSADPPVLENAQIAEPKLGPKLAPLRRAG